MVVLHKVVQHLLFLDSTEAVRIIVVVVWMLMDLMLMIAILCKGIMSVVCYVKFCMRRFFLDSYGCNDGICVMANVLTARSMVIICQRVDMVLVVNAIITGLECAVCLYMVVIGILMLVVIMGVVTIMFAYIVQSVASWNKSMSRQLVVAICINVVIRRLLMRRGYVQFGDVREIRSCAMTLSHR